MHSSCLGPEFPVERILITEEIDGRPYREPDYRSEALALRELAKKFGASPKVGLQALCDQALSLCHAESAGLSIAEVDGVDEIFRWHAVAGHLKPFLNTTMPRHF